MSKWKNIRCKARCGLSIKWGIGQTKDGKWRAMSLGDAKNGRSPVPTDFVPFELSNAVYNGPKFDTPEQAEAFVRSL
jgi:hypothetical protein